MENAAVIGAFSDLADQAVLIPAEVAVFLSLICIRRYRPAFVWAFVVCTASFVTFVLKLWFERCGLPAHRVLYSPSGHTMGGTLVYGGLLALFCQRKWVVTLGAVMLASAFAASRLYLHVHTPAEVVAGGSIGLLAVGAMRWLLDGQRVAVAPARLAMLLFVVGSLVVVCYGHRSGVEEWISRLARSSVMPHAACAKG
ncbi:PA-phosphatase-like phosphoesterase [Acetobacter estunensis NRIC 0472]|uniref:Phosphatase PAP2 family protein n=1 Tax=Acetobacter estunensis TaxID=104097 RepID=A0A967EDS8_9PROT|nr:phosphatase PAP2 family protein [Acetobacter estunensis]NHO54606.1 phosphatase PAP2 family protein [Acetobacter estunensis]GBQ20431.1 PA-phosphatase-like phosphoesterase [Acetobacter estunensis NRIC 0472]